MPANGTPRHRRSCGAPGVDHEVHEYEPPERHGRDRDERPGYGLEAAAALGVDPARMFKTLIAIGRRPPRGRARAGRSPSST